MISGKSESKSLIVEYSKNLGTSIIRHRADVAERARRVEAERTSRITSQFIANMSHELRTPLNSIIGFSDLLKKYGQPGTENIDVPEYGDIINDGAQQLLMIINEILDISRIQSGKMTVERTEVYLDEVVENCIRLLKTQLEYKKLKLVQNLDIDLPPVLGDAIKLRQVVTNIIGNAIKFTPENGEIRIATYEEQQQTGMSRIVIAIEDNGVGMSADEIDVALTPFGQIEVDLDRETQGTGLGLPISKSLIAMQGGKLEIESEKGEGTKVIVSFPKIKK